MRLAIEPHWAALIAFALSLSLTPILIRALARWEVLDHPSNRSLHNSPIPRGGGVALGIVTLTIFSIQMIRTSELSWGLVLAGTGFLVIGALEDFRGVSAMRRFLLQVVAATGGAFLFASLSDSWGLKFILFLGAVGWLVSFANAFNFMDGINGISVVQVLVAALSWYLIGESRGFDLFSSAAIVVAGATLGFAPYNFPNARVFLGDSGSYFLGAWLAYVVLLGIQELPPEAVLAPLGLYLADAGSTLLRRFREGKAWAAPHREHVYQQLVAQGRSHAEVTFLVLGLLTLCSILGALSLFNFMVVRVSADMAIAAVLWIYLRLPRLAVRQAEI